MLHDPTRINAHVVRHHVTGQADAASRGAITEGGAGGLSTEIIGDGVVKERVGRGCCFRITTHLLDGLGSAAALPQSNEPKPVEAAPGKKIQFFVRYQIQTMDVPFVTL